MKAPTLKKALSFAVALSMVGSIALAAPSFAKDHQAAKAAHLTVKESLAAVKRAVAEMEGSQPQWTGPTTGPKAAKNKFIVYISGQATNNLSRAYGIYMAEAAKVIGWRYEVINASGSPTSWLNALNEAIALKPNGIAMFANAATLQGPIKTAVQRGIVMIGLHAAAEPGPQPSVHLFTNLESDPAEIGRAEADYIIAATNGNAKVVVLTHNEYAIAYVKSQATLRELKSFPHIKVEQYSNIPASDVSQDLPQLTTSWVQRFGMPLYITTVGDSDFDYAIPTLRSLGISTSQVKLVGSDGTPGAYSRIKSGQYQVATIPEPDELQAWEAIDDFNRAFHHMPASTFIQPVHLVTRANVEADGGSQGFFNPANHYEQHYKSIWGVK